VTPDPVRTLLVHAPAVPRPLGEPARPAGAGAR